ncbi:MAG: FtsX-like permease family protein [Bacteroidota bacterium]
MKLRDISINNLRRRKGRMIFILLGLVIGVSTVVSLITISRTMGADVATKLDEFGANILIVPRSDNLSISYGGISVSGVSFDVRELHASDLERLRTIKNAENISIVAPKLLSATAIGGREVLIVGVDFPGELRLKKWWRIIGEKPGSPHDVLIGSEVKQKLNLAPNSTLTAKGEVFRVCGILEETGSQDDGLIFADLRTVQRLFNKPNLVSLAEVAALCYNCPIEEIVRQTSEVLPNAKVTAIKQSIETKMEAMHRFSQFSIGISVVVLIVGAMIVFTTVMGSVNERTREIGVFRALGFRQSHVRRIILAEVLITSFVSGVAGYWIGYAASSILTPFVVGHNSVASPVDWLLFMASVFLAVTVGFLAAIYPAHKASRLDPTVALRAL